MPVLFPCTAIFAVLLGANVGTTVTAWLVSFKLAGVGAIFLVLGMIISMLPWRYAVFGKSKFAKQRPSLF